MVKIECVCPPKAGGEKRHPDGDTVTLRERLDFRAAVTVRNAIVVLKQDDPDCGAAEILAVMTETYLMVGIESWSLVDASGPIAVNRAAIREYLLSQPGPAMVVGDAADELYSAAVLLPLLVRAGYSLPPTPMDEPTPATNTGSRPPPKRSKSSSITTSPMGATVTTSDLPAGVSSSLLNLE